jgi:5-methylcytosine-specific restriction protein A
MPTIRLQKKKPREVTYNKRAYQWVYNTPQWRRLRAAKLREDPICEECAKHGLTSITQEIHHRIPFEIMRTADEIELIAYDYDNLVSLCTPCHKEAHEELKGKKRLIPHHAEYR